MSSCRLLFMILALGIAELCYAQTERPVQTFALTVSTTKSTSKPGADIKLKIIMQNISDHVIFFRTPITGRESDAQVGFITMVLDSEGKPVPETLWGLKVHGKDPGRAGFVGSVAGGPNALKPGKLFEREFLLNEEYDLSKPGRYTVQALREDLETRAIVKSNILTLEIVP